MLRGTAMDGGGTTPAASDEAVIDLVTLSGILGETDPAELAQHLDLFFSHFPSLMDRIDDAIAAKNVMDIATTAHTAMGAAGMAGAARLRSLLMRIEIAARAGDGSVVAALVPRIRPAYADIEAFVAEGGLTAGQH